MTSSKRDLHDMRGTFDFEQSIIHKLTFDNPNLFSTSSFYNESLCRNV